MGHQFKSSTDQECELVAGAMPVCLLGTIKVPLSLAPNLTTTLGAMEPKRRHSRSDISPCINYIGLVFIQK